MVKKKIYLSASTQQDNIGVAGYGSEEKNMFILRDRIEYFMKIGGHGSDFEIHKNKDKKMTLTEIVADSNNKKVDLHVANHTNAGPSKVRGCEVYYHYKNTGNGKRFAYLWYSEISAVTPTTDRGVRKDNTVYESGNCLYETSKTTGDAALCEHIYHTNEEDVKFFTTNVDLFAIGTAKAIYRLYDYKFVISGGPLDWKTIIRNESKWADLYIRELEKNMKETGYNWPGLIQKIKYD